MVRLRSRQRSSARGICRDSSESSAYDIRASSPSGRTIAGMAKALNQPIRWGRPVKLTSPSDWRCLAKRWVGERDHGRRHTPSTTAGRYQDFNNARSSLEKLGAPTTVSPAVDARNTMEGDRRVETSYHGDGDRTFLGVKCIAGVHFAAHRRTWNVASQAPGECNVLSGSLITGGRSPDQRPGRTMLRRLRQLRRVWRLRTSATGR